jgi:hypothetical protein
MTMKRNHRVVYEFPNLTDRPASATVESEILAAGAHPMHYSDPADLADSLRRDVTTDAHLRLCGWHFKRAWGYWSAHCEKGNPIPRELARYLWSLDIGIRANRDCRDPEPDDDVSIYDVDSPAGLTAMVAAVKLTAVKAMYCLEAAQRQVEAMVAVYQRQEVGR